VGIGAHAAAGEGWGEVKSMHVVADRRGEGIGDMLLAAIEQAAVTRGDRVLRLETGTHLTAAIGLYERAGYRRRGPFGTYGAHPATIFMEKDLARGA
jgi:putative acetyltransferase